MPPKRTHSGVTASPVSRKRQRGEEVDVEPHNQGSSNAAQCKSSVMESDTAAHVSPFLRDSSDSGPLCIDLEPSESSDGASTSTGDARPGRLAEIADELKADDVPSNTDDMMNVLTSAMPELRGSLADRARSLLAAGRTPLAAMLRSVVRYTARGTPPGNQIAGRSTRSEDPSQSTLKKPEENQPPELSYLLTPSPRCEQSNSNLGLVSFTTLPNTPASSKCDSVPGTDVRSTSPSKLPTEQQENPGSQGNRTKQQNTLLNYFDYVKKYQHVDSTNQTQTPKIDGNPANVEKEFLNQTNCQLEGTKKNTETQSEDTADIEKAKNKADLKMEIEKHSDDKPNKANDNGTETEIDDVLIVNETLPDIVDLTALDSPEVNTTPMKFEPISSDKDSTIVNLTIQDDDDDDLFRTASDATSAHTQTLINDMDEIDDLLPAVILPKPIPMNSVPLKQEPIQAEPAEAKPGGSNSQTRSAQADRRVRRRGRRGPRAPRGPRGPRTSSETSRPGFQDIANDLFAPATGISFPYSPLFDLPEENDGEEEEEDEEEMGVAETYAPYRPANSQNWCVHPDPVVETASLSSVEAADMTYALSLPAETVTRGRLSAVQLEAVVYAAQAHGHLLPGGWRAGFLIGDGAGVGKGRTIAGIIFENYLKGRKRAVWVSVSNDLKYDAERDLRDIGAGKIEVYPLNKFKYDKISSAINGNVKKGVVFCTYSALIGETSSTATKYRTRLKQLLQWCGEDFDGCIVFDECHKAKNLCPVGSGKATKTGLTALELQNKLPKARVVYASATGASEPRNMAYMVRLGIWGEGTPFPTFMDFINAVEKRGVGAMEIVAMDMKLRGMYIARQLSFHGVTFKIEEVPLSEAFRETYDKAVALWVEAMQRFTEAAELIDAESRMKKVMWGQFWSAHQRFFKYLCIAAKVNHAVVTAREAVKCGKCVVIGLQSTGEARTLDQLERDDGELSDFVSTAKGVFQTLVEKHFPAPDRDRINRLLGLEAAGKAKALPAPAPAPAPALHNGNGLEENSNKRKLTARQQANAAAKRARGGSSSDEFLRGSDDDSDRERARRSDSDLSDFNPFRAGSDSDDDPWVGRQKKKPLKKKAKASSPKKKTSTQDKIETMFERKNSATTSAITVTMNTGQSVTGTPVGTNGLYLGPSRAAAPPRSAIERACGMKEELLAAIERLGRRLPPNTLDQLVDELGGTENVAEMTGRKGRVVQTEDGQILYESRSETDVPLETLNLTEKQRFMDGEKDVAIISEAASSGISLQSDRRARNQRRRVHITLELPWSADRAIQQFGRTHRSNQVNAPEYIFLISDLAGERRFASTVAKRLESLGALTHGDRRATETRDLSQFNIDNKYGRSALEAVMRAIMKYEPPLVAPPRDYAGDFFQDVASALVGVGLIVNSEAQPGVLSLDKDYNNMSKFLNRILGMPVELQNRLFKYFTDTLAAVMEQAKRSGRFDLGILDLGSAGECVRRVKCVRFLRRHATGRAPVELHTVHSERGMDWAEALEKWSELTGPKEGFYLSLQPRNNKYTAVLCVAALPGNNNKTKLSRKETMFQIYRPNTGLQLRQESLAEIEKKYKKVESSAAETSWRAQYSASLRVCSHAYWRAVCRNQRDCEVGLRVRTYHVLSGSVLAVWARVEGVLAQRSMLNKMQVVRIKTTDSLKIVGTMIPKNCVDPLKEALSYDAVSVSEQTFDQTSEDAK